jgi:NADPH:quinone reductase-like Zn-dependent oxidoreductase
VVEVLGPGTSGRLAMGQRVVAADWGEATYQEYVAVDEKHLVLCTLLDVGAVYFVRRSAFYVQASHAGAAATHCDALLNCAGLSPCHGASGCLDD